MELFALLMSLLAYLPFLTIALAAQWSDRHENDTDSEMGPR